jgi:hypothetical protein
LGRPAVNAERIARYLAGRLSASETREFEAQFSQSPDIVQEMEETARFQEGLAALRERGELKALVQSQPSWRRRWVQFGVAASLGILVVGGALWVGLTQSMEPVIGASPAVFRASSGVSLSVSATYRFITSRDAKSTALQIVLPATPAALEFMVLPENRPEGATYKATLSSVPAIGDTTAVGILDSLQADSDGFIRIFADSARLASGAYELVVGPESASSARMESRYKFVIPPTEH